MRIRKLWTLLPVAVLAAGAVAAAPAMATTSAPHAPPPTMNTAPSSSLPKGVTVSGGVQFLPALKAPPTHAFAQAPKAPLFDSGNWAGYVDVANSGKTTTRVGIQYDQPKLNATQQAQCVATAFEDGGIAYAYYWDGLDGWTDPTVEQAGTATYCESDGTIGTFAWWETFPGDPVTFTGPNPGDHVVVIDTYRPATNDYQLYYKDFNTGGTFTANEPCEAGSTCDNSSAEVITEDPGGGPPVGLASYGSVGYFANNVTSGTGVQGTLLGSSAWSGSNKINEVFDATMQTTSNLNKTGATFSDAFNWNF